MDVTAAKNLAYRASGRSTARKRGYLKGMVQCRMYTRLLNAHKRRIPLGDGILSHQLHAFDGAGRSCVALGKLVSQ